MEDPPPGVFHGYTKQTDEKELRLHLKRLLFSLILAILSGIVAFSPALAFPPLPSSFYGQVRVNDQFVPDGTLVRALIGGTAYAETRTQTYQGSAVYNLTVPGDDASTTEVEGGQEGDVVQFEIGGVTASQSGAWHGGTNQNLDLSAGPAVPLPTSQPTEPPTSQPTAQPTTRPTRTPAATRVPPTAANPTLQVPTATAVQPAASPTVSVTSAVPSAAITAVSTAPGLPAQVASQTTLPPEPTQASLTGGTSTAVETGDGTAPSSSTTPDLLFAAVVGVVVIGGAAWLVLRRKK
jgi:hypothetical protein